MFCAFKLTQYRPFTRLDIAITTFGDQKFSPNQGRGCKYMTPTRPILTLTTAVGLQDPFVGILQGHVFIS